MNLPEIGVKRPITTLSVFLVILIVGLVSLSKLGIDLMPDITLPAVTITTVYPGAGTEDVEKRLTKVIEDAVSTVPNVDKVVSKSVENISSVVVIFKWGTNIDAASLDVREAMSVVGPVMPSDAKDPMIFKFDASLMPVLFMGISAKESYPDLYKIIDKKLSDPLSRVSGVGSASAWGGLVRQINVKIDGSALAARGLSIGRVTQMLAASNITIPAGNIEIGTRDYSIRVPGEFKNVKQIGNVVIGNSRGVPVYLKDVAVIEDGFKKQQRITRMDGVPSLMLIVQKQSGANTVKVADAVWKKIKEIEPTLPKDIEIRAVFDGSQFIRQSINNLAGTVLWAAVLVVLVVLLFLRNVRSSLIIAFILPFSLIVAFIFLYTAGYTINIMSLSSLAISIGMVVDNGIVVFENIYRHRTEFSEGPKDSAVFGTREVASAITASTLTTVVIFIPLLFVEGIAGILFKELGFVIIFVLAASLFTALYLTPMLSSRMLKVDNDTSGSTSKSKFFVWSEKRFQDLENFYSNVLQKALAHKKRTIFTGIAIFVVSMFMFKFVHTEFFPQADQSELTGIVELNEDARLDETNKVMQKIEKLIDENVPERKVITSRCGTSEFGVGVAMGRSEGTNVISIQGTLVPKKERKASDKEIAYRLSNLIKHIPGVKTVDFTPSDPFTSLFGGGKPIEVEIYGYDLDKTMLFAQQVKEAMLKIKGTTDITVSRGSEKTEYWVDIDRAKAASLGLTVAQIAMTLRNNYYGNGDVKFREKGDEYPIFVQLMEKDRNKIQDIGGVMIPSPFGTVVPLKSIATIEKHKAPVQLERKNQQRIVTVGSGVIGRALGSVANDLKISMAALPLPSGVEYKMGGSVKEQADSFKDLLAAMLIGILLVYLVMAAQFESLIDPFIIMFAIPFAVVGVVWALFLTGTILSINAFIGLIMLVGIVVNNGIVLIDYTNMMRARGLAVSDAVIISGKRRLRPVLMTSLTTIFGLLPLALSTSEGSETWVPLGVTVIGGLLASTVITLVFVPTLYAIFEERLKGKRLFKELEG